VKTLSDYHKKVLGISLNGKPQSAQTTKPEQTAAGLFCFLCIEKDFEQNKELVLKILKATGAGEEIVFFDKNETEFFNEVFSFGLQKENSLGFESFSEISKSPVLKKKLWSELKKRTAL